MIMNVRYIISCLLLLFMSSTSCTDDESSLETKGYLELGVSKNVEVITRAFNVEDQSLYVDICAGANDSIVKHFSDYNDMAGERVLLDVGTYKVKVSSNPYSKLEFEQPTFYGEKTNVAVTAGKTTPVSVECFLSCVKVTTEFTKPVKDSFESVVARISDKSGSYLDYNLNETRAGYFQPGYILVDLTLTNKEGYEFKMSKLVDKTEARDHYHLVFDLIDSGDNNSGMDFDISIEKDPTNDEKHTVTVPLPETGYGQKPPVVTFAGAVSTDKETVIVPQKEQTEQKYNVNITAKSENTGINKVQLLTQTTSEQFAEIPAILTLTELPEESNEYKILSGLGFVFPLDYSNEKTEFVYQFSPKLLNPGDYKFTLLFQDKNGRMSSGEFTYSVKSEISTENISDNPEYVWSRFAQLRGYAENPNLGGFFKYKEQLEAEWKTSENAVFDGKNASFEINNLKPETTYEYKFCQGDVEGDVLSFTTDAETEVLNLSLDDWNDEHTPGGWWDSGNSGTSVLSFYSTMKDNGNKNSCVKMVSSYMDKVIVKKFVAGNIFLGSFVKANMSDKSADIDFGKDYTSRFSELKFDYKYTSATVNRGDYNNMSGKADMCHIYVALTTNIYHVNTNTPETFIKASDEEVIAFGEFYSDKTIDSFTPITIKLKYKSTTQKPNYLIIVATSSKYGDYFTGGEGSTLWLDELELVYPNKLEDIEEYTEEKE